MHRPLLSFYGDDFTGSTDVMEALASNGVPTVLFLDVPDDALFARFGDFRAFGLAGTSRSQTPEWMSRELPAIFRWLEGLKADVSHYKVCSTFDSSPRIGNIGKAIEIGMAAFGVTHVPLIVGTPELRRYTAFGNLFAGYQDGIYRIDRHPVMSRHPVTPMHEADLAVHLAAQTDLPVRLADLALLASVEAADALDRLMEKGPAILLMDVDSRESQLTAGRHLLRLIGSGCRFVTGSSGIEYALIRAWRQAGMIGEPASFEDAGPVERMAAVSGSVSPTTERQIRHAALNGFGLVAVDPVALAHGDAASMVEKACADALQILRQGRSVLVHTALGPSSDRGEALDRDPEARHRLGAELGRLLLRLIEEENLGRAVIAGGDTSSHALRELKIKALTTCMPLPATPGSPLAVAHGPHPATNGLQIALKGGQVGRDDYFLQIRDGRR